MQLHILSLSLSLSHTHTHTFLSGQAVMQMSQGHRPTLPMDYPDWLTQLIVACWHQIPSSRPAFETDILPTLQKLATRLLNAEIANTITQRMGETETMVGVIGLLDLQRPWAPDVPGVKQAGTESSQRSRAVASNLENRFESA